MGGQFAPEWVVTMQRNDWTVSGGMGGHFVAEYAIDQRNPKAAGEPF
jgi:hypothetical protein